MPELGTSGSVGGPGRATARVYPTPINDEDVVEVEGDNLGRLRFNVKSHGPRKEAFWGPPGLRPSA